MLQLRIYKGIGNGLVIAARAHGFENRSFRRALARQRRKMLHARALALSNGVEANHARDLLNQIRFNRDVKAMRRRRHLPSRRNFPHTHLQGDERGRDCRGFDGRAQKPRELCATQANRAALGLVRARVHPRDGACPAPRDLNQ